jgi:penicillin-binding protein 2
MNSKLSDTTTGQEDPKGGLLLLYALVLGLFCLFVVRFWYLQVLRGDYYTAKSRENRLRESSIYAPRGLIRERGGDILVSNEPAYALGLVREECVNVEKTLKQVSAWTGTDYDRMMDIYKRGKRKLKPFEPIILSQDIPFEVLAQIEANSLRWPGLEIITRRGRHYKQGVLMAHVLGYVAEANEEEMDKDPGLAMGDTVGKQGLEYVLEKRLRGVKGVRQVEVDATGRPMGETVIQPARPGEDVTLSIDLKAQQLGMEMLKDKTGAVVAMDADTGQLVALVSSPSFDSNAFAAGLSTEEWKKLRDDEAHPLQNRAIQSVYPPGSVFKLVMAGAALAEGIVNPKETVLCTGEITYGTHVFRCWKKGGHGSVNMHDALVQSCDVYFYRMGEKLGVDRISRFAKLSGFGGLTGIDLPHEKAGIIPSREWKLKRFGERWTGGENLNLAIGQGYTVVSPLQVARFVAALVNGGKMLKPSLLAGEPPLLKGQIPLAPEKLAIIRQAMIDTVETPQGTAKRIAIPGATLGAKTGTAQVVRLTDKLKEMKEEQIPYKFRDHAWMAAFGEKGNKRYSVVAMVEHGLHGASGAGPVVKAMFDYLFDGKWPSGVLATERHDQGREGD